MPSQYATVLVLEDDEAFRSLAAAILKQAGYNVLTAGDSNEAIEVAAKHSAKIDLLLTDILLPGLSGPEFARELREQNPGLKVILMSGSGEPAVLETTHWVKNEKFLPKPYNRETILLAIREALEP